MRHCPHVSDYVRIGGFYTALQNMDFPSQPSSHNVAIMRDQPSSSFATMVTQSLVSLLRNHGSRILVITALVSASYGVLKVMGRLLKSMDQPVKMHITWSASQIIWRPGVERVNLDSGWMENYWMDSVSQYQHLIMNVWPSWNVSNVSILNYGVWIWHLWNDHRLK